MRGQMAHLDAEILAEFQAGLITGRRGTQITAHLAGCDRCTALGGQLAGVSALLASVPVPAMPASVAQRLDTILTTENAARSVDNDAERARADRPGHPVSGRRRKPRPGFRLLSARVLAPVAVVLLAAGGYGLSRAIGPAGQVTTSSGSSAGRVVAGPAAGSGPAKAAVPSAAASNPAYGPQASASESSPPVRGAAGSVPQARRLTPANFSLVASTVNFSAATFRQQVEHELGTAAPAGAAGAVPAVTLQLRACVQNLTGGAALVRVESARFEGQPAILVVARTGPDDTAWIAGPDCSATSRDVLATATVPAGTSEP
jgi:hypothetical protein